MIVVTYGHADEVHLVKRLIAKAVESCNARAGDQWLNATIWDNSQHLDATDDEHLAVTPSPNIGFGKAVNHASRRSSAEWLLLMNPDVEVSAELLEQIRNNLAITNAVAWAPRLLHSDGSPQTTSTSNAVRTVSAAVLEKFGRPTKSSKLQYLSGALLAVRRTDFLRIGGFDERFFLYSEDVDLSVRLSAAGHKLTFEPSVTAIHRGSGGWRNKSSQSWAHTLFAEEQFIEKHQGSIRSSILARATDTTLLIRLLTRKLTYTHYRAIRQSLAQLRHKHNQVRRADIIVYDPNGQNPYGRELSILLSKTGNTIVRMAPPHNEHDSSFRHVSLGMNYLSQVRSKRLPPRLLAPIRVTLAARRTNALVVLVWTRSRYDAAIFLLHRLLGSSVIVIDHNPPWTGRFRSGGSLASALGRVASRTVVHGEELLPEVARGLNNYTVAPHPPYSSWWSTHGQEREDQHGILGKRPMRLLLIGEQRPDKGSKELPSLVELLATSNVQWLIAGKAKLDPNGFSSLARSRMMNFGFEHPLSDRELADAIASSDLMVAPYTNATQSGSIILALTANLPVIAFDSRAIRTLLTPPALVPTGDIAGLASRVRSFINAPFDTFSATADELASEAVVAWGQIIDEVGR